VSVDAKINKQKLACTSSIKAHVNATLRHRCDKAPECASEFAQKGANLFLMSHQISVTLHYENGAFIIFKTFT
jgi:hypothetical protein